MKIAIILPNLSRNGPIFVAQELVCKLCNNVDLIDVYYFDDIVELSFNCNTKRISFWEKIDFDKYDIIHSHMLRPDLYIYFNRKLIKKAKTFTTLHQYNYEYLKNDYNIFLSFFVSLIWTKVLKSFDKVVTLTLHMNNYYSDKGILNSNYIYNGRNISSVDHYSSIFLKYLKTKYKILGTTGLLIKRKGIDQVINLLKYNLEYYLIIIGDGSDYESLLNLAVKLNVTDRCLFLGKKSNPFEFYVYFDLFVFPTRNEGMPMSLIEAAALNQTVVCSNIPVLKEIYSKDEVSFFELDNIDSLDKAVKYALNNTSTLSFNLNRKYNLTQTSELMASNYHNLYLNTINT